MRKCYRNAAALIARAVRNNNIRAMAGGDLAHDGEAEAAAGTGGSRHAVEALEHPLALGRRNTGAVVLHFDYRLAFPAPGAHGHTAAALRGLDGVVHEVRERLAQQELVALHAHRLELEAEIDVARERLVHPLVGLALGERLEIHVGRIASCSRLGARER